METEEQINKITEDFTEITQAIGTLIQITVFYRKNSRKSQKIFEKNTRKIFWHLRKLCVKKQ